MKKKLLFFPLIINLMINSIAIAPLTPTLAQTNLNNNINPEFTPNPQFWSEIYQLGAGDQIIIQVQRYPNLDFRGPIAPEGTVVLGLIGTISLQGLTISQAQKLLTNRFNEYFKDPLVSIALITPRPVQVVITGEVTRPGFYPLTVPQIPNALAAANGTTNLADLRAISIRRTLTDGRVIIQNIDLLTPLQTGTPLPQLRLQDGDTIVVPSQSTALTPSEKSIISTYSLAAPDTDIQISVVGAVAKPGFYKLKEGSGYLGLALIEAGGITTQADLKNVTLKRSLADGRIIQETIDLYTPLVESTMTTDVLLKDGDHIYIPELTPEQALNYDRNLIARTSIAKPKIRVRVLSYAGAALGNVELANGSTFLDALNAIPVNPANLRQVGFYRFDPVTGKVISRTLDAKAALTGNISHNPLLQDYDVIVVNRNILAKVTYFLSSLSQPFRDLLGFVLFFRTIQQLNTGR